MSATPTLRSDRVRLAILLVPKPGMSAEQFWQYWVTTHSKIFTSIAIVKKNLLKYEQFHIDDKYNAVMTAMVPGYIPLPSRGMAIFEAESMEKIMEVFQDDEYHRVVVPDEEMFISRKETQLLAGPIATVLGA